MSRANLHANPEHIFQVGLGLWASKILLSAIEPGLFTHLSKEPMTYDATVQKDRVLSSYCWRPSTRFSRLMSSLRFFCSSRRKSA